MKEGIRGGCKWSLLQFNREHPDHPLGSAVLWARIKAIVNLTLLSIAAGIPDNGGCFELFGYDVSGASPRVEEGVAIGGRRTLGSPRTDPAPTPHRPRADPAPTPSARRPDR